MLCLFYLDQDGRLPHVQEVLPLKPSSDPALEEDDLGHDVLVQRVLQLLPLRLLQENLENEANQRIYTNTHTQEGTRLSVKQG